MIEGSRDRLGDEMKAYEAQATSARFERNLPVYARIDGRSFSSFTRGMQRPFEEDLSHLMQEVTRFLVEETGARCGFTQSDEISLVFLADETPDSEIFFGGREFKMTSQLASLASARFLVEAVKLWPERCAARLPTFDARVFQLPGKDEAVKAFLWRYLDGERNAISMVAQSMFSHQQLQGVSTRKQLDMIEARDVHMQDFPEFFTCGTFMRRVTTVRDLSPDEVRRIPAGHRPAGEIPRSDVVASSFNVRKLANLEGFIFEGEEPDLSRQQVGWKPMSSL